MKKDNKIRRQIYISICIAGGATLFAIIYLLTQISNFSTKNKFIIQESSKQLNAALTISNAFQNLSQSRIDYIRHSQKATPEIIMYNAELLKECKVIDGVILSVNRNEKKLIERIKTYTSIPLEYSSNWTEQERIKYWLKEQKINQEYTDLFLSAILDDHQKELKENNNQINFVKRITISLILIGLGLIAYAFYKIYQMLYQSHKASVDLKYANKALENAQYNIEATNWILEKSAYLADSISGIDNTSKISNIVAELLNNDLDVQALAIYVRKIDSYEFERSAALGLKDASVLTSFTSGEGLLGKAVEDQKTIIQTIHDSEHLNSNSATTAQFPSTVFIVPLVYEELCLGIMEIAMRCPDNKKQTYIDYFTRISKLIANRIKFGQSHLLVEHLLEETQRQTEELEAQQEELRITNDELVHKTHLLESSEEELRVQQEELTQTNIELNHKAAEVEKRNTDLNNAQKIVEQKITEVQQASKYKSEFMANMSHELRTPLNSILILAKLLQDNKFKNLNSDQVKYAGVIHAAGSDLLELINELLDLAKIESGAIDLNIDEIHTEDFISNTEELFKAVAKDKGIVFKTHKGENVPDKFLSDEYRLQQVIKNFLSNAFKFTPVNGIVNFSIKLHADNLLFEVKDSGIGISQDKQDLIFEAFKQEDGSTSRRFGGTGLGLSISKEIASLLGGRISLESTLNEGSTFILTMPLTISDQKKEDNLILPTPITIAKPELKTIADSKERKILIVEDDINFADILKGFAEDYGFKVSLAHDGAKGIEIAKQLKPDAIILDVMLPIADGWEVLRILKEDSSTKHIPVHMMSAASFAKKDFLEKGAIGFMHKPVSTDTIQNTFETININLSQSVKKILLVEDQELQSDFIKNSFADRNINVIQTFSLAMAWEKLKEEPNIDCIILDLELPDGNGLDLIEKIKSDSQLENIPIIINTAYELSKAQYDEILANARATVLKSGKSNDRLIDEVNLFLNKINDSSYRPIKNIDNIVQTSNLKGKKVLIADDDMRNVFALSTSLQSFDMKIEIANNGSEAVEIMRKPDNEIDIILMDIMMPEMDGYEAIKIIREELKLKNIPILAVTAKAMKGDREKSIQMGANDYVSKPIAIDKLTSLMQVWLS